jgi:signal transduction histidine kinase
VEVTETPLGRALDDIEVKASVVAADGTIAFTNRAWRRFGEENDNPSPTSEGANYLGVCREADDDPHAMAVYGGLRSLLEGDRRHFRTTYPCHSPEEDRWFDLYAWRFEVSGEPYALVLHTDVTERAEADLAVHEEVDRLEAVSRILAHDLRNPLTVAYGYAELLGEEVDSPYLVPLRSALVRLGTVLDNAAVLAASAAVDGVEPVALADVARAVWADLPTDDATLAVVDEVSVAGDPDLVSQLLENLLRNSVEHGSTDGQRPAGTDADDGERGSPGGRTSPGDRGRPGAVSDDAGISVRLGALDGGGFYVEDDGPGVPPAERESVFRPGYTTGGAGTGFGLDIVRRIARAHGWEVTVSEGASGGARFEVATDGDRTE